MRAFLAIVLVCFLGIALGIGIASQRIRMAPWNPELDQGGRDEASPNRHTDEPAPKVVVDQPNYDFGKHEKILSTGSHDFVFSNAGTAPLRLALDSTSCRCTMSKLGEEPIPPGKSAKVTISWKLANKPGPFEQTAVVQTNDPENPTVTLKITGRIATVMQLSTDELVFSSASTGEASTAHTQLVCFVKEPLKILGHELTDAATAKFFDVAIRPLTAEELKEHGEPLSGVDIAVTVKPGLPQGSIRQSILLRNNIAEPQTLFVRGIVNSEIAVLGKGWDSDDDILDLGTIQSSQGAERRLMLLVRGSHRQETEFKIVQVLPDMLEASLSKRTEINQGAVLQTTLTIKIPPGSPTSNHLGTEQGELGEIILETTHPQVPKLRIRVRFAVKE